MALSDTGKSGGAVTLQRLQVVIEANTRALRSGMAEAQRLTSSAAAAMSRSTAAATSSLARNAGLIRGAFSRIARAASVSLSARALTQFGRDAMTAASNLIEVQNVVDVTFGHMSDDVDEFAETAMTQFGLTETAAKKYASSLGAMFKSSGIATAQAKEMSVTMSKLAADMASFYNIGTDQAYKKIQAGLSGQVAPLRQLGITMTVANLNAYAMAQGIEKSYREMTQAEKTILRYNYLLEMSADAQGDFARTSGTWANQTRILGQNFERLKTVLGQGLIAAVLPLVKILNQLLERLQGVAAAFRDFVFQITGTKPEDITQSVAALDEGLEDADLDLDTDLDVSADIGLDDAETQATRVGNALGDGVAKAARAAQGFLGSLDEINRMTGGDGGDATTSLTSTFSAPEIEIPEPDAYDGLVMDLKEADAYARDMEVPVKETPRWLSELMGDLSGFMDTLGTLWNEFVTWISGKWREIVEGPIGDAVRRFVTFWKENIDPMIGVTAGMFKGMVEDHVSPMVDKLQGLAEKILPDIEVVLEPLLVGLVGAIQGIIIGFGAFLDLVGEIFDFLGGIWDFCKLIGKAVSGDLTMDDVMENSAGQFLVRSGDWINQKATDFNAWLYKVTGGEGDPYEAVNDDFDPAMAQFGNVLDEYGVNRAESFWQLFRDPDDTRTESPIHYYQQEAANAIAQDVQAMRAAQSKETLGGFDQPLPGRVTLDIDGTDYMTGTTRVADRYNTAVNPYSR